MKKFNVRIEYPHVGHLVVEAEDESDAMAQVNQKLWSGCSDDDPLWNVDFDPIPRLIAVSAKEVKS